MSILKKAISILLSLMLVISTFSGTAVFAAEEQQYDSCYVVDSNSEKIEDRYCTTDFQNALSKAKANGTVYLDSNVTLSDQAAGIQISRPAMIER